MSLKIEKTVIGQLKKKQKTGCQFEAIIEALSRDDGVYLIGGMDFSELKANLVYVGDPGQQRLHSK